MTLFDLFELCQNIRLDSNVRIYNGTWKVYNMEKALDEYGMRVIKYFRIRNDKVIEVYLNERNIERTIK